jgi:WD40 repeat protein
LNEEVRIKNSSFEIRNSKFNSRFIPQPSSSLKENLTRNFSTTAVLILVATWSWGQHPIVFDDMAAMRSIGAPVVSPDGKWVAYDASTIDLPANYRRSAIYLVPSNGGDSRRITDGVKQDEGPAWSPDGKTIA